MISLHSKGWKIYSICFRNLATEHGIETTRNGCPRANPAAHIGYGIVFNLRQQTGIFPNTASTTIYPFSFHLQLISHPKNLIIAII
ncbi:MAG: hypothetical protein LBJ67_04710 [Planctomycetaceae bacterium]|nr:hypothetical protein [Planctomycetaceae bacterium]